MPGGQIYVITGPSGVGKGSLCQLLLADDPRLCLSISATSRPMRAGEADGVNYYFKTRPAFEAMIAHDAAEPDPTRHHLLEWAEYNGNYYGTPRSVMTTAFACGKSVLLEIETQGALMVKAKFPAACLIFIAPPDMDALAQRLRGRGTEAEADIQSRLKIAHQEMALQDRFDHVLINHRLNDCKAAIQAIMAQSVKASPPSQS